MSTNPLFPTDDNQPQPPPGLLDAADTQNAVDLIREKVARVYSHEPDAREELARAEGSKRPTKHQQFMQALSESGKDMATIQTEWHNYYQSLPEEERHQVWQEFYESQPLLTKRCRAHALAEHKHQAARPQRTSAPRQKLRDARSC